MDTWILRVRVPHTTLSSMWQGECHDVILWGKGSSSVDPLLEYKWKLTKLAIEDEERLQVWFAFPWETLHGNLITGLISVKFNLIANKVRFIVGNNSISHLVFESVFYKVIFNLAEKLCCLNAVMGFKCAIFDEIVGMFIINGCTMEAQDRPKSHNN